MRRTVSVSVMAALALLSFFVPWCDAENKAKAYSLSPFVGGYMFEGNEGLNNRSLLGLRAGYDVTKNWGVEGLFEFLKTEYDTPGLTSRATMYGYRLEALYHFTPEDRWVPYLAVGAGGGASDTTVLWWATAISGSSITAWVSSISSTAIWPSAVTFGM